MLIDLNMVFIIRAQNVNISVRSKIDLKGGNKLNGSFQHM